jgi:hypothetical protein
VSQQALGGSPYAVNGRENRGKSVSVHFSANFAPKNELTPVFANAIWLARTLRVILEDSHVLLSVLIAIGVLAGAPQQDDPLKDFTPEQRASLRDCSPEDLEIIRGRIRVWKRVLGLQRLDLWLDDYLFWVSPLPDSSYVKFTTEVLSDEFLDESMEWFSRFFQDKFNPLKRWKRPTKYYLGKDNRSLLCYEWSDKERSYQLIESSAAVLLRVTPLKEPWDAKQGIDRDSAYQLLASVLNKDKLYEVAEARKAERARLETFQERLEKMWDSIWGKARKEPPRADVFPMPRTLKNGTVFSNAKDDFNPGLISHWSQPIVGFVTDKELNLLLFKERGGMRLNNFLPDEDWLPKHLFEKDGKTPVWNRIK